MLIPEDSLPQGSPEWLVWRRGGIGDSEVYSLACQARHWLPAEFAALARAVTPPGEQPGWVSTPRKIWMDKHGLLPPLDRNNPHLVRGHRVEPVVRELAEETWGCTLEQVCAYSAPRPRARVSLDGFAFAQGILIEVKAPARYWTHRPKYPEWQAAYQSVVMEALGYSVNRISILEGNEQSGSRQVLVKDWPLRTAQNPNVPLRVLGRHLLDMVDVFWERFMATDTPPDCIPRERDLIL